jgi:hypothetical protein
MTIREVLHGGEQPHEGGMSRLRFRLVQRGNKAIHSKLLV